jgi:hypothetical protein
LRWGLENFLPELAANHDPPHLSLLCSQDYRHEPQGPSLFPLPQSHTELVRTPGAMLNKTGRVNVLPFLIVLEEKPGNFSLLSTMLATGLLQLLFIKVNKSLIFLAVL